MPAALSAFVRGAGRRALLFAVLQAGEGPATDAALARALAAFVADARDLPMGRWPARFWRQLLLELPKGRAAAPAFPGLEWLPPPGAGARAALLLALVAGLDEEDGGAALGADAATWRLALRRAAPRDAAGRFDEAAWRALAVALRDAQRALPEARLAWWERASEAALAAPSTPPAAPALVDAGEPAQRRRTVHALWLAVAACALAFAATFAPWRAWFAGDGGEGAHPAPAAATPLASVASPAANYDAGFALRHHPDLPRLLAGEDALLRDMDFGAWYAAQRAADPARAAAEGAGVADPYVSRPLPAFDRLSPAQRLQLQQRAAADGAMPGEGRGALRERWEAWQRLPAAERSAVRDALAAFSALPAEAQAPLRNAFAMQPVDLQRGWLLGPTLGAHWPRLQPLLQQVPAEEREPLLARLHAMDAASLDALDVLAQRTPPQGRDALRREVLAGR